MSLSVTHIGVNIRFLRRIRGLSQAQLAKAVDLSRNNIASYESGMVEPNSTNFIKIASYFQVNPQDLLEKILSENPAEVLPIEDTPKGAIDNYVQDQFEEFTKQTNSFTKILEGYCEFYDLQVKDSSSDASNDLKNTMDDILVLMRKLAETNWKVIQSVYPANEDMTTS